MKYTLAFDVYGTMINTSGIYNSMERWIGSKAKPFIETWRNKQLEYTFRRGLMQKYVPFSTCTEHALEFCCQLFEVHLDTSKKNALIHEYATLPAFTDVVESLQDLKTYGYRMFAFSNGSADAVSKLLKNAKILDFFDGVISTEEVNTFKPNPLVYAHFNKKTNTGMLDSYLVSSNPFDVIGAISYGMRTIWVKRTSKSIMDPWGMEPKIVINTLTDLHAVLQKQAH